MKLKTISPTTVNRLRVAMENYLLDHGIGYESVGLFEKDSKFHFVLALKDKGLEATWDSNRSIGLELQVIAEDILKPMVESFKSTNPDNGIAKH